MRAFIRQIMLDTTVAQEIDKSSISEHTCLPTGFSSLDHALGGGLHFKNVIELCGKTNTGKTEASNIVSLKRKYSHAVYTNSLYPTY